MSRSAAPLMLYKRLANADEERVLGIAEEMVDRFGTPPAHWKIS